MKTPLLLSAFFLLYSCTAVRTVSVKNETPALSAQPPIHKELLPAVNNTETSFPDEKTFSFLQPEGLSGYADKTVPNNYPLSATGNQIKSYPGIISMRPAISFHAVNDSVPDPVRAQVRKANAGFIAAIVSAAAFGVGVSGGRTSDLAYLLILAFIAAFAGFSLSRHAIELGKTNNSKAGIKKAGLGFLISLFVLILTAGFAITYIVQASQ